MVRLHEILEQYNDKHMTSPAISITCCINIYGLRECNIVVSCRREDAGHSFVTTAVPVQQDSSAGSRSFDL